MSKDKQEMDMMLESILDINANNIWNLNEAQVAALWESDRAEEGFASSEEKLLNIIRLSFEVVHFNPQDEREAKKYENGDWAIFARSDARKGMVAIRRKFIKRITDLSYENVKYITAATLRELIDRNFGGGWDSIPLSIKDIIESSFDISTTQLPTGSTFRPIPPKARRWKASTWPSQPPSPVLNSAAGLLFPQKVKSHHEGNHKDCNQWKVFYSSMGKPSSVSSFTSASAA